MVDGIRFASKAEARRYGELKLLLKAGEVRRLELQPTLTLLAGGMCGAVGEYRADFKYLPVSENRWIYEDVKGVDTPLSRWKRKHVKAQYGIDVEIVKR